MEPLNIYLAQELAAQYKENEELIRQHQRLRTRYVLMCDSTWRLRTEIELLEDDKLQLATQYFIQKDKNRTEKTRLGQEVVRLHRKINRMISDKNRKRAQKGEYLVKLEKLSTGIRDLINSD